MGQRVIILLSGLFLLTLCYPSIAQHKSAVVDTQTLEPVKKTIDSEAFPSDQTNITKESQKVSKNDNSVFTSANLVIAVAGIVVTFVGIFAIIYGLSLANMRKEALEHLKEIKELKSKAVKDVENIATQLSQKRLDFIQRDLDVQPTSDEKSQAEDFIQLYEQSIDAIFSVEHHFKAAIAYRTLEKWDEMLAETNHLLRLNPRILRAYILKSFALMCQGRNQDAVDVCNELIYNEKDKVIQKAWYNRASAYACLKMRQEFLKDLEFVISLNPAWKESAKNDPDFQAFRDDPDFKKLIQ